MNVNDIRRVLTEEQIQLTKALGQNFLHDANQLRRIVKAAEPLKDDPVLEIGPGLGALTQLLLGKAPRLLAIEKDRRLFDCLNKRFANEPHLTLLHADALDYLKARNTDWSDWKLVSNLPYSAASPMLAELARCPNPPAVMVVTLQLEVAQRLAAPIRNPQYGVLSLLVQLRFDLTEMFQIPPTCFFPIPEIESACVKLVRRRELAIQKSQLRAFEKIVRRGFSQRRKMMLKLLKADWPLARLEAAFEELGLSPQARAESVTVAQFAQLTNLLEPPEVNA